jgi:hypothetical protein
MSLSLKKLDTVNVKDPRVQVNYKSDYVVLEGASQISQKLYTTTSVSNSSLQFSCPPPSGNNFVDRKVFIQAPVRLTFLATSTGAGQYILNAGQDAPRQFGFSAAVDVYNATINNFSVSNNIGDYIHPLLRYNCNNVLKNGQYSTSPSYPDQSQLYSSLYGSVRNPLAYYGDSTDENVVARGGFPYYEIVSQTVIVGGVPQNQPSTATGQLMTSIVDIVFIEPFFLLSPLYWGLEETHPFVHVNTMDFNITILGQAANRMWSRSETALPLTGLNFTFASLINSGASFSFPQTQPTIQFNYLTPKETQMIPQDMISVYNYHDIQRFPTDFVFNYTTGMALPSNNYTITSNNVQVSSIPRRIYIFGRPQNSVLQSSPTMTDTFLSIENISIQYYNRTGILSSASKQQLFQMSRKNGCNMSWNQWSGGPVYQGANLFPPSPTQLGTVGSVLCIDPACDLGLDSLSAPGKIDHTTLQVTVQFASLNPAITNFTLYIVLVNEGVFSIGPGIGQASAQIGVLSSQDILDAKSKPMVNYELIKSVEGGDFLSGLKQFFSEKVLPLIKQSRIASNLANLVPVVGPALKKSIRNLGYGDGVLIDDMGYGDGVLIDDMGGIMGGDDYDGYGSGEGEGVTIGGRMMGRHHLKKSMRKRVMM